MGCRGDLWLSANLQQDKNEIIHQNVGNDKFAINTPLFP